MGLDWVSRVGDSIMGEREREIVILDGWRIHASVYAECDKTLKHEDLIVKDVGHERVGGAYGCRLIAAAVAGDAGGINAASIEIVRMGIIITTFPFELAAIWGVESA